MSAYSAIIGINNILIIRQGVFVDMKTRGVGAPATYICISLQVQRPFFASENN